MIGDLYSLFNLIFPKEDESEKLLFLALEDPDNDQAIPDELDTEIDTMPELM